MADTMILISSTTLSTTTATINFTSIPQTYTDLYLVISARTNRSFEWDNINITFNNTGTRTWTYVEGDNSNVVFSTTESSRNGVWAGCNGGTSTTATFGNCEILIPSYTSSYSKPFIGFGGAETASGTGVRRSLTGSRDTTTTAINSIAITATGSFVADSTFYLYGIKNS